MDALRLIFSSSKRLSEAPRFENLKRRAFCKIVHVIDGDSVVVAIVEHGRIVRRRCRLYGMDTPEMRGPDRERAIGAREALAALLPRRIFVLHILGLDKYGRLLVKIRARGRDVGELMILQGHAVPYFGGKK